MSCSVVLFCCPVLASRPSRPVLFWVSFSVGPVVAACFPLDCVPGRTRGGGVFRRGVKHLFHQFRFLYLFAENKRKFVVSVFRLQKTNGSCPFLLVPFSVCVMPETWKHGRGGHIDMELKY
jgi:hypothetical protein